MISTQMPINTSYQINQIHPLSFIPDKSNLLHLLVFVVLIPHLDKHLGDKIRWKETFHAIIG